MRVVLANKHFLGLSGGAERNVADLANFFCRYGFDVFVVSETKHGLESAFPLDSGVSVVVPKALLDDGDWVDDVWWRHQEDDQERLWAERTADVRVRWGTCIRQIDPDVILTFMPHTATILAQELGREYPIIVTNQNDPAIDYFSDKHGDDEVDKRLRLESLNLAASVHFLVPPFVEKMPAAIRERSIVIPNAAPKVDRNIARDRGRGSANKVVAVGRLEPQKGFALLIEAFKKIPEHHPDWQLHIFGKGPLEAELRDQIKRLRLQRSVILRGFTSEPVQQLAGADIFVIPSAYEGWGLTLTEAMSVGLPCVGMLDCSGVNWLIKDGENGVLVERNPESLASAINHLIHNPLERERLGLNAQQFVDQFAPDIVYDRWAVAIEGVVGKWQGGKRELQSESRPSMLARR